MRITFITPVFNLSGGSRVIAIHAQHLARMGHDVCVISTPPPSHSLGRKLKNLLKGRGWPRKPPLPPSHLDNTGLDHRILDRFRAVIDTDVPDGDVVIATFWGTAHWVSALSSTKGTKIYFIQHHEIFPYMDVERCKATYRLPLHKIVISRWLKEVMSNQYGDRVVDLVPNSIDRSQFFSAPRGKQSVPTVGFLYSDTPFKGLDVTLAALKIVTKSITNLRIVCFGSHALVPDLQLPKNAKFFHSPPQNEIRDIYSQCDVWVTASRSEGFNLPAMEAMACRTPVVSTRTGWPEEAVRSGWNGVLVDVDDIIGLAKAIEWVLSRSEGEWNTLSKNALATTSSGSWDESAKLFEKALLLACQRAKDGKIACNHSRSA